MTRGRYVALAAVLAVGVTLASGSAGFSSATASRSVEVAVVDDDVAFLGVELADPADGGDGVTVTVANRFPRGTTLRTVEITVGNGTTRVFDARVESGGAVRARFADAACGDRVRVEAAGESVDVRLNRSVACGPAGPAMADAGDGTTGDG
jgi:hypothetical protein